LKERALLTKLSWSKRVWPAIDHAQPGGYAQLLVL